MDFNTIDINTMLTVLDTLRWSNIKFRDLAPAKQIELSQNLPRVLNETRKDNDTVIFFQ